MRKPKVVLKNVSKEYSLLKSNKDKLKSFFINKKEKKSFFAVKNINFEVYPGETIGIIGINGSGKSTMSNLLAEVIPPTTGEIIIDGESSLIAISVGLNGQLSGLENIHLKCMMHGMTTEEIDRVTPKIIEFADIGSFIEQPVKNYSSGMKSRLGFAVSVHTDPDVLIVDEALSVGDQTFYDKCMKKIDEFKQAGKTIFFVSHSAGQMKKVSDRVMWMHYGEIREFGDTDTVINKYTSFIKWFNKLNDKEKKEYKEEMFEKQTIGNNGYAKSRMIRSITADEKKDHFLFNIQLAILSFILLIMMSLIISSTSIKTAWKKISYSVNSKQPYVEEPVDLEEPTNETKTVIQGINKKGYVLSEQVSIYKDVQLKDELLVANLFDEVHVISQYDDEVYKVKIDDNIGFVKITMVDFEQSLTKLDISIQTFFPYLSDQFNDAYSYYLSFLDETIVDVEQKLIYLQKQELTNGEVVLGQNSIEYHSLDGEKIQYLELMLESDLPVELINQFKNNGITNVDKTKYFIETTNYYYTIDINGEKIIIYKK